MVKRPDLMDSNDAMLEKFTEVFIKNPSPIIQSRFCLFLSFYLDQAMTTRTRQVQESFLETILMYLFTALKSPDKMHKIVSLQALDALTSQVNDTMLGIKIQENFDWIIRTLSDYNVSLNLKSYFDFLGDFIKTHFSNFTQDNLVILMQSLVERIQKEIKTQEVKLQAQ